MKIINHNSLNSGGTEPSPTSIDPNRYYIYAKSPYSARFGRLIGNGYTDINKAIRVMLGLYMDCKTDGTEYQVRKGRSIVYAAMKGENNGKIQ